MSRHDYMAFGEEIQAGTAGRTGSDGDKYSTFDDLRKQFTGYERDVESGLDFAQARYYNSGHGRFTSPDPLTASATIRDPQSFNRYTYASNSPYKFTDPLGLLSQYTTGANGRNWDSYGLGGAAGVFTSAMSGFLTDDELTEGYVEVGDLEVTGYLVGDPQGPVARPWPTPKIERPSLLGPCAWEEERDMNYVAQQFNSVFNYRNEEGKYNWGFRIDSTTTNVSILKGLKAAGFTQFPGAHKGMNMEGNINGNWYHIAFYQVASRGKVYIEHHFELSRPSSLDHKLDWVSGRANRWVRPSQEECKLRRKGGGTW